MMVMDADNGVPLRCDGHCYANFVAPQGEERPGEK
jgi:hypothetical protein